MKEKWISSIMAGIYIAMGAMVYFKHFRQTCGESLFCNGNFTRFELTQQTFHKSLPTFCI